MKRLGLLLALGACAACNAQAWDFADDASAPGADAAAESGLSAYDAPSDAPGDVGYSRRGDDGGTYLGRCNTESDCTRIGLHCLLTAAGAPGTCVPCLSNADCQDPIRLRCDTTLYRCVECDIDADCQPGEVCLGGPSHSCVPICPNNTVCPARASYCDDRALCLACRSAADCRLGQACDFVTGRCVDCLTDADCRRRPLLKCDHITATCVQCLHNSDCGRGACLPIGICIGISGTSWWDG